MKNRVIDFYNKYKHGIPLLVYAVIYLTWFFWLEQNVRHYQVIHMAIDDYIPFCEVFVIPYFLWFAYVSCVVAYLFFKNKRDYYRTCLFLFTGMTIFLIVSTVWPNGHHLRLETMPRDNIFTAMIAGLWQTDTATNLWPSIHVYNSLGAHFAVMRCRQLSQKKGILIGSGILSFSIIASTVLIKQHSMFDVITAFILAGIMYIVVYVYDPVLQIQIMRLKQRTARSA